MKIIQPVPVSEGLLTHSNVAMDDYPEWAAGEYDQGDRVIVGIEAFEALATTSADPTVGVTTDPPSWLRLGYVNRWRMFRDGQDSKTRQDGGIELTVSPGRVVNGLTLLGVEGLSVTVTMTDPLEGEVYERTETVTDIGVGNWFDFYFAPYESREDFVFLDLPPYSSGSISVVIETSTPEDEAALGRFVMGAIQELGFTLYGTSIRSMDFSIRERDGFGNLTVVERRQVDLVDYEVGIEIRRVDYVKRELDKLRNQPTVFIGSDAENYESTVVFGYYRDFEIVLSNYSMADANLEVEGY